MKPTDPPPPPGPAGAAPPPRGRRPGVGGGPTYRHPQDEPDYRHPYDDGVLDHAAEDELHNPEVAHEHTDVNVRAIITSAAILVVVAIVSHIVIYFMFGWMEREATASEQALSPHIRPATEMPRTMLDSPAFTPREGTVGPQLLTNEPMALARHREAEARRLQGYGWVDQKNGVVHIPIEEAKKRLLEQGLAVRADGAAPADLGTRLPVSGESSGGRAITVPLPEPPAGPPSAEGPPAKPDGGH